MEESRAAIPEDGCQWGNAARLSRIMAYRRPESHVAETGDIYNFLWIKFHEKLHSLNGGAEG